MEAFGAVLLLAAIVVGVILFNRAKSAATTAAYQKVLMRGAHRTGQEAVGQALVFDTSATRERIIDAIRRLGWGEEPRSAIAVSVWTPTVSPDRVVFVSGNKLGESFRAALTMTPRGETGTHGVFRIERWKSGDGIISDGKQMLTIRDRVHGAIVALDPSAAFESVPDARGTAR